MKSINLADKTIERVQAWADQARGVTEDDVINHALDCFEQATKPATGANHLDSDSTVARFRRYRGMLADVTVADIVASRPQGLH